MIKIDALFYNGIKHPGNNTNLTEYFIREFKKAKKDYYTIQTFFPPLYQAIGRHKEGININYKKGIEYYKSVVEKAKRNELVSDYYSTFKDREGIDPIEYNEKYNQIKVDEINKYLDGFTIDNVISQRLNGFTISELFLIEEALKKAEVKVKSKSKQEISTFKELQLENDFHPDLDPNFWNEEGFRLFKYLFDNYYYNHTKKTKRKLTNIWFYFNYHASEKYTFLATKDGYKKFIKDNYSVDLTNMDKPGNFENKELKTIDGHRILFEKY